MRYNIIIIIFYFAILSCLGACGQTAFNPEFGKKLVGGACEGCEAIFEYGKNELLPIDTLPGFYNEGRQIKISGTIFKPDGKTPAPNVILYVYHTNKDGIYENKYQKENWASRHGYIRGWLKTGKDGKYCFYTTMPGAYPDRKEPAHIHPTILEPDGKYYWLHSILFEGDSLLENKKIEPNATKRGNSGLLTLGKKGVLWEGDMDFILGKNIPGYH